MPELRSIFFGTCWRCWPAMCRCPPDAAEVEQQKSQIFLLDQELRRENRRAREFADALRRLGTAVLDVRNARMEANGLEDLPEDLFKLGEQAQDMANLLAEPRNQDRIAALYRQLEGATDGR